MKNFHKLFSLCSLLFLLGAIVSAAEPTGVNWKLEHSAINAARGETVNLKLIGEVPQGWHTYSSKTYKMGPQPTQIAVPPGVVEISGRITSKPEPVIRHDDGFNTDIEELTGTVTFEVPLRVKDTAVPGRHRIVLTVTSQLCNERECIGPDDLMLPLTLTVVDTPAANAGLAAKPDSGTQAGLAAPTDIAKAEKEGLGAYLWLSLAAGATALLTPCVFPMIPITVSFFIKRRQVSRRRAIRDAGIYSLGIILMFTGIGFLFALLLGATGITDFATNPWVNLLVAGIFLLLAFSLLGMYEIQLPEGIIGRLTQSARPGEGIGAVLLMGLVFALTSFTCTVPFVGALLVSATQGDWLWPLLGMLVFATVFSAPFFLLALFPAAMKSLPRAGGWLNSVKVLMGLLEIAAAMKFLSNTDLVWRWGLLTREVFLLTWIGLAVLATFYLLGRVQFAHDRPVERLNGLRWVSATGFFSVALFLASGLFGRPLGIVDTYAPPEAYPGTQGASADMTWLTDWDAALAEAQRAHKPIFVDYTGYTCTNCRRMETGMFSRPEISGLLKDYVRVQLHTDGRKDAAEAEQSKHNQQMQQTRYRTTALPFYAVVSPNGTDIATFPGYTEDAKAFEQFLVSGRNG